MEKIEKSSYERITAHSGARLVFMPNFVKIGKKIRVVWQRSIWMKPIPKAQKTNKSQFATERAMCRVKPVSSVFEPVSKSEPQRQKVSLRLTFWNTLWNSCFKKWRWDSLFETGSKIDETDLNRRTNSLDQAFKSLLRAWAYVEYTLGHIVMTTPSCTVIFRIFGA